MSNKKTIQDGMIAKLITTKRFRKDTCRNY